MRQSFQWLKFVRVSLWLVILALSVAIGMEQALADIKPARDGTGTRTRRHNNRVDIDGGRLSEDRRNLFHSFERFGLSAHEVANFLSNPDVRNILGRVTGGDPSMINGLIRVSGGNANLFLMNPAGIVFGRNARLDIPGSFTATTANGIGFGDHLWFNALGSSDYQALVGDPNGFAFTMSQPGAIVNAGDLSVGTGQTINFFGGTVVNTGTISTAGGQVRLTAVPGENMIRLSQEGMILQLDIPRTGEALPNGLPFNPLALPQLLTVGAAPDSGLAVNPDNSVQLATGTVISAETGTTIASGTIDVSSLGTGGTVDLLGDRIGLVSATIDASGDTGGGTVHIGGDYQGQGTLPRSDRTYVSRDSLINVDAGRSGDGGRSIVWSDGGTRFYGTLTGRGGANGGDGGFVEVSGRSFLDFAGDIDLGAAQGQFGSLLLDPENIRVIAGANVPAQLDANDEFGDLPGASTISNGTINEASANVILQATNDITFDAPIEMTASRIGLTAQALNNINLNADIKTNAGNIFLSAGGSVNGSNQVINTAGGDVTILGTRGVTLGGINAGRGSGDVVITSANGFVTLDRIIDDNESLFAGSVAMNTIGAVASVGSINVRRDFLGTAGDVNIGNNIVPSSVVIGGITTRNSGGGNGGNINVTTTGSFTTTRSFNRETGLPPNLSSRSGASNDQNTLVSVASEADGNGGAINIDADGGIVTSFVAGDGTTATVPGGIASGSRSSTGRGGNMTLTSDRGAIVINGGSLNSTSPGGAGGNIRLNAATRITVQGNLDSRSQTDRGNVSNGGEIELTTGTGNISAGFISSASRTNATGSNANNGGRITLTAANGTINTGTIDAISDTVSGRSGSPGEINFTAGNGINIEGNLFSDAFTQPSGTSGKAGNITLTTTSGNVRVAGGLFFGSLSGRNGGSLTITAPGAIDLRGGINARGADVTLGSLNSATTFLLPETLNTEGGSFTLLRDGDIEFNTATNTAGGDFILDATGAISVLNAITTSGGDITIGRTTPNRLPTSIDTSNTSLQASGRTNSSGGAIALTASGNITTGSLRSSSSSTIDPNVSGGDITLRSTTGTIDTGVLNTSIAEGNDDSASRSGDVTLSTQGNITTGTISTYTAGTGQAGSVNLTVLPGAANPSTIRIRDIDAGSSNGNGGAVTLSATGDITVFNRVDNPTIYTGSGSLAEPNFILGNGNGGRIFLESTVGNISLPNNVLDSTSFNGSGGAIDLSAANDISVSGLFSYSNGAGNGGNIQLSSTSGSIIAGTNRIDSTSVSGGGGGIRIGAGNNVTLGETRLGSARGSNDSLLGIDAPGLVSLTNTLTTNGADLTIGNRTAPRTVSFPATANLTTNGGTVRITTSRDFTFGTPLTTNGGTVTLITPRALTLTSPIQTNGGDVTLRGRSIDTRPAVALNTSSTNRNAGAIDFAAVDDLFTGNLSARSTNRSGGRIVLSSSNGDVRTRALDTRGGISGGAIQVTSPTGGIRTGNLTSTGTLNGGEIVLQSEVNIQAGAIDSRGRTGNGGDVTLDPQGDVQVDTIRAEGGRNGGNVDITSRDGFFRAIDSFTTRGARSSISTTGGQSSGDITIRHGGRGFTAFNVGNLGATNNGTAAAITSGGSTISPDRSFPFTYTQDNIRIITADPPVDPDDQTPAANQPIDPKTGEERPEGSLVIGLQNTVNAPVDLPSLEISASEPFRQHLNLSEEEYHIISLSEAHRKLKALQEQKALGINPALLYVFFSPTTTAQSAQALLVDRQNQPIWQFTSQSLLTNTSPQAQQEQDNYQLQLVLVKPEGLPIYKSVPVTRKEVLFNVEQLNSLVEQSGSYEADYLPFAEKLYNWIIEPLQEELQSETNENDRVNTIAFIMDAGLRSIPMAALSDPGEDKESYQDNQYLIEKYKIGLMPSLSLSEIEYRGVQDAAVLAMGASDFKGRATPLLTARTEVTEIADTLWSRGTPVFGANFTPATLQSQQVSNPFGIVHLSTHARFNPNQLANSYIEFANESLSLDQLRSLQLKDVELLVLSACATALGNEEAELGFAGIAVQSGAKSALGSLWEVNEQGTLALMTEFYRELRQQPMIKAEALRRAQIALLKGEIKVEDGEIRGENTDPISLPGKLANIKREDFTHPYYWSAFTIIGSPW